ncbi:MAG: molybdenum cofactor guanylyltransferase [Chloroflexi bacterium]|nr:molybdenum cofactor guanylyltransferase [Chloroflexota bacterium]MCY3936743.1 molybdenum cofactor guanylyltransferase [Chloroflexota bacterium]
MNRPTHRLTGAILAGGRSRRMGRDKAELVLTLPSGERLTMLQQVHRALESVCDETLVVGGPARAGVDARRVADRFPGAGPLAGILSALLDSSNERVFVVACDMPFVDTQAIEGLAALMNDHDAIVPRIEGRFETLHAIYKTDCAAAIRKVLDAGDRRVRSFFSLIDLRIVTEEEFAVIDPGGRSSMNVNYPEEFESAADRLRGTRE